MKAEISLKISWKDGRCELFTKQIEIPFVPARGMDLINSLDDVDDDLAITVVDSRWVIAQQLLVIDCVFSCCADSVSCHAHEWPVKTRDNDIRDLEELGFIKQ